MKKIRLDDFSELIYVPFFISTNESEEYMESLKKELLWRKEKIKIFGKEYWQPRLLAWYGDVGTQYRYSGINHQPEIWTETLLDLKNRVEQFSNAQFNSVLANFYRDGKDGMGWHSDNEKELGKFPIIASLSFGHERRFCIRPKKGKNGEKYELELGNGALLIMKGAIQINFEHAIPKTSKNIGERINLTFRNIKHSEVR